MVQSYATLCRCKTQQKQNRHIGVGELKQVGQELSPQVAENVIPAIQITLAAPHPKRSDQQRSVIMVSDQKARKELQIPLLQPGEGLSKAKQLELLMSRPQSKGEGMNGDEPYCRISGDSTVYL